MTAKDVVFTFGRARDPALAPGLAQLLRRITSVTAEGDHRVVFRFPAPLWRAAVRCRLPRGAVARPSAGRSRLPSLATSPVRAGADRQRTVSMGAARAGTIRRAGRQRALLPRDVPAIRRVVLRLADGRRRPAEPAARRRGRRNRQHSPAPHQLARVAADRICGSCRCRRRPLGFLLFNQRDPRDTTRAHPILSDLDMRRAIGLALDRRLMVQRRVRQRRGRALWPGLVHPLDPTRRAAAPGRERPRGAAAAGGARLARPRWRRGARPRRAAARADALAAGIQRHPSAVGAPGTGTASPDRHPDRPRPAGASGERQRRTAGQFDIDFSADQPGPVTERAHAELVVQGWHKRRALLRSRRGLADRRRDQRERPRPGGLACRAPPHRGPTRPPSSCTRRTTCMRSAAGSAT